MPETPSQSSKYWSSGYTSRSLSHTSQHSYKSQSHEETKIDFIKIRCLQIQFLPSNHPSLEFFAGHCGRGPWLGILQAGAFHSYKEVVCTSGQRVPRAATIPSGSYCSRIGLFTRWRFWKIRLHCQCSHCKPLTFSAFLSINQYWPLVTTLGVLTENRTPLCSLM